MERKQKGRGKKNEDGGFVAEGGCGGLVQDEHTNASIGK